MRFDQRRLGIVAISLVLRANPLALAQGGPPLITDDPGTPGNGHWEINIAAILARQSDQTSLSTPYFDINYGWGDHLQLKFETGWTFLAQSGATLTSGVSDGLAGVKWRFLDQATSGVSVSTYPQLGFHHFLASSDPVIAEPGTQFLLPIELAKEFAGGFALNPEVGYLMSSQDPGAWVYGLVWAYQPRENLEFLSEVHGTTRNGGDGTELLLNVGARVPFSAGVSGLVAVGRTVSEFKGELPQSLIYLGTQLRR